MIVLLSFKQYGIICDRICKDAAYIYEGTCKDLKCPCHPSNHDQGCTLCILKNLREKEIPSCFFNDIDCRKPTEGWHYDDFAALVQAAGENNHEIVAAGLADIIMINPEIIEKAEPYEAEEGCLSLPGTRKTTRYKRITVRYLDSGTYHQLMPWNNSKAIIVQRYNMIAKKAIYGIFVNAKNVICDIMALNKNAIYEER